MSEIPFKKGDWVIFPGNRFPVKLESNAKYGHISCSFTNGPIFCRMSRKDGSDNYLYTDYCVQDPRESILGDGMGYSYFFHVIRAKKKDFLPLINMAKKQLEEAKRLLKIYEEIEFFGDNS